MNGIDTSSRAIDGVSKVSAEAAYLADMQLPGMLHGKILRSPLPHARIGRIDTSRAACLPGVIAVITAADMPAIKFSFVPELADKYPLCPAGQSVRYIGDEIAAVAAVDETVALDALQRIDVQYEPLGLLTDPEQALGDGAPRLHESGNVAYELIRTQGDLDAAFAACDCIVEEEYQTSRQAHAVMEPRGCIAHYDRTGHLTVWHQTQAPHTLRAEVARALGIPQRRVRIIQPETGGGFGARLVMNVMVPIAAVLSLRSGHPVRILNSREEEFQTAGARYPYRFRVKLGATKDGIIRAKRLEVMGDNGAYHDKGPSTINFIALSFFTSYDLHSPAAGIDARLVYTNKPPGAAFRGFGHAEERFAFESALDIMAARLGLDPVVLRSKNLKRSGERLCLAKALPYIDAWRAAAKSQPPHQTKKIGIGVALLSETGGGLRYYRHNSTEAIVKVERDGSVGIIAPVADTGTGTRTVMAQIVAEHLGIQLDRIHLCATDTDIIPYDLGSWASRTTFVCGNAVAAAAADARRQLAQVAAAMLHTQPENIVLARETIALKSTPATAVQFDEVVEEAYGRYGSVIVGKGGFRDAAASTVDLADYEALSPVIAACCHVAQVAVDVETGEITVPQYLAIHDVGKIINLKGLQGQVEGGVAQGIGFALSEELVIAQGQVLNPNFIDYAVPRFQSVPGKLVTVLIEGDPSDGPYGAKGIGELTFGPAAPAIANAIHDAVGIRPRILPMTAERIRRSIAERNTP